MLMSKFTKISILLLFLFLGCWFFLFKREKDSYILKDIEVKTIVLDNDSIFNLDDRKLKNYNRIGISIIIKKEFVSGTDSKRTFLGGSMEKGLNGITDKIKYVDVKIIGDNKSYNDGLVSFNYLKVDENELGDDLYNLYEKRVNFNKFINDIINNETYTRGISFDNYEVNFWFNKELENYILQNRKKLILTYEINNKKIIKKIN